MAKVLILTTVAHKVAKYVYLADVLQNNSVDQDGGTAYRTCDWTRRIHHDITWLQLIGKFALNFDALLLALVLTLQQ